MWCISPTRSTPGVIIYCAAAMRCNMLAFHSSSRDSAEHSPVVFVSFHPCPAQWKSTYHDLDAGHVVRSDIRHAHSTVTVLLVTLHRPPGELASRVWR